MLAWRRGQWRLERSGHAKLDRSEKHPSQLWRIRTRSIEEIVGYRCTCYCVLPIVDRLVISHMSAGDHSATLKEEKKLGRVGGVGAEIGGWN